MKDLNELFDTLRLINNQNQFSTQKRFIENEIEKILLSIRDADRLESANIFFEFLNRIQTELAKLLFKKEIDMPNGLKRFVRDFDRVDDFDMRIFLFKKIKWENYSIR
jgi:hypothetical protein